MVKEMAHSGKSSQNTWMVRADLIQKVIIEERFERTGGESHMISGGRMLQAEEI